MTVQQGIIELNAENAEKMSRIIGRGRFAAVASAVLGIATVCAWTFTVDGSGNAPLWATYGFRAIVLNLFLTVTTLSYLYIFWCDPEQRGIRVFRVVVALMPTLLIFGFLELLVVTTNLDFAKFFAIGGSRNWLQVSRGVNRPDPLLIHLHWPHSEFKGHVTGNLAGLGIPDPMQYPVHLKYDHNGFRNPTDLHQADIVAIGDSFLEAALVEQRDIVTSRMERRLDIKVANLGQSAYGLKQELEVLKRFGKPLQPKIVLWFFFGGNDLAVDYYERQKRHFNEPDTPRSIRQRLFIVNSLEALSLLTTPANRTLSERARNHRAYYTKSDGGTVPVYFGFSNGPWEQHEWDVCATTLTEARDICEQMQARLAVVYISRKYRIYKDNVKFEEGVAASNWTVNELPKALGNWCRENGIEFINTADVLSQALKEGRQVHFQDDAHWNAEGHKLVADLILGTLEQESWVIKSDDGRRIALGRSEGAGFEE